MRRAEEEETQAPLYMELKATHTRLQRMEEALGGVTGATLCGLKLKSTYINRSGRRSTERRI